MDDEIIRLLAERAAQPAPLHDSVGRTAFAAERPSIPVKASSLGANPEPLDPYLTSMLGGLADTGSTLAFLKRGTANEDNALMGGLSKHPGTMAALGAAANVALPLVLKHTLGKKFPKIAEALAANQGALQMGYGALNTQNTLSPGRTPEGEGKNTSRMYRAALAAQMREQ